MAVQDEAKLEDLVAELHRLKSLLDEGDEVCISGGTLQLAAQHTQEDRLDDLRSRYAELKQQNDELEACFEEALAEAKKLQEENIKLREEHQQALLQAYVPLHWSLRRHNRNTGSCSRQPAPRRRAA